MGGGWGAFGTREQDRTMAKQEHVKLLSPPGRSTLFVSAHLRWGIVNSSPRLALYI